MRRSRSGFLAAERKGYIDSQSVHLRRDTPRDVVTLIVSPAGGTTIATVSLAFDSGGLPCDEVFRHEVDRLRERGRKLVEVTALALGPATDAPLSLLTHMFGVSYQYARRFRDATDLVIEVNPKHVLFYRRRFLFDQIGEPRSCPRVLGAPAVLMHVPIARIEREATRTDAASSPVTPIERCRVRASASVRTNPPRGCGSG